MAKDSLDSRIANLEATVKSLQHENERLKAVHEIQNLMSRHAWLHMAGLQEEELKLWAQKTPGVKMEVARWGVYEGNEGIERLHLKRLPSIEGDRTGCLVIHTNTTPVIEVAGDGKTAKGVWLSPGLETLRKEGDKLKAYWVWMKHGVDFVKEDGQWKFWHHHAYGLIFTPYEKSWVEAGGDDKPMPFQEGTEADRPSTYWWTYSPNKAPENIPAPPEPYETWDEKTAYVI